MRTELDIIAEKNYARETGLAEGRAEGLKEGRAEGREIGLAEGKAEGKAEVAKQLLARGMDLSFVSSVTGLSEEELKAL